MFVALVEEELEEYLFHFTEKLPRFANLQDSFLPFYIITATRKFFFLLDHLLLLPGGAIRSGSQRCRCLDGSWAEEEREVGLVRDVQAHTQTAGQPTREGRGGSGVSAGWGCDCLPAL